MAEAAPAPAAIPDPYSIPIEKLDVARGLIFAADKHWAFFERLRREDPVHFCPESEFGPYWSVTKYNDIMAVDTAHDIFSSEPAITIADPMEELPLPMFIAMDPPRHEAQRKVVTPVVAPPNLALLEPVIRERAGGILDDLPRNETFNWVDRVSIELTTQMLATLFDFPWADRRKLTRWSDVATAAPGFGIVDTIEQKQAELLECAEYFTRLWQERAKAAPKNDLISMMAHGPATQKMDRFEYLGNLILLIVGGNDTTRNSITGSVYAQNLFPREAAKLRANPALIPSMVSETIRWQTPLAHMRRRAVQDTELGGKRIAAGDKVVMWYISGNRDEEVIPNAMDYLIDRPNVRRHLSFGFGIHRCLGARLAEMQLRIVWEEILKRFGRIDVVEEPTRIISTFVHGYNTLRVRIPG